MLFFCRYDDDHTSLLVDDESEDKAREVCLEVHGAPPAAIKAMPPRACVFEVAIEPDEDDEDDDGYLEVTPLDHVADMLAALENNETAPPAAESAEVPTRECGSEADGDLEGEVYACTLERGHDGEHEDWGDDGKGNGKGEPIAAWGDA